MTEKLILEVRANEFEMRRKNDHIPFTPDELIEDAKACHAAGATAYHFHTRNPDGSPNLDYETYRDTVQGILAETDLMIHPSLGAEQQVEDRTVRLANIRRLCDDGIAPDFAPLDMGSSNFDLLTEDLSGFVTTDRVYVNTTETLLYFAAELRDLRVKPYLQMWNVPNLRLAATFHRLGHFEGPLWMSFGLSEKEAIIAHPGTSAGLRAFIDLLPADLPVEWSTLVYHGDMLALVPEVVDRGGHVAIGLGDYHYTDDGRTRTNADLVAEVRAMAERAGRDVATPAEGRTLIGLT